VRDLLVAVPSRGRPQNIARLWDAMQATCQGDTHLLVGLDWDDPTREAYPPGPEYVLHPGLRQVVAWVNHLTAGRTGDYRFIGHIGDDNVPRTPGWDTAIMEALKAGPFAFANDLYPGREPGTLSCHVFTRAKVIETLGYIGPPGIRHMYVDVAWMAWGKACGITYLHDVLLEHLHYTAGKAPPDESYQASTGLIPVDLANWHAYSRGPGGLNADIGKLGGQPFTPDMLRDFNRGLFIPEL
jgi:hypothetical protein